MTQLNLSRKKRIQGQIVGQPQTAKSISIPAPIGGWNAVDSLVTMPPTDAVSIVNMIARQTGVTVRPGFANWATGIGSTTTNIRTVAGFNDTSRDSVSGADRLFAFTDQGIYNITTEGTASPTLQTIYDGVGSTTPVAGSPGWLVKGGLAGWVQYVNFTNSVLTGGKHYLVACDLVNGYHLYDPTANAGAGRWYKVKLGTAAGEVTGIDPTLFVNVCMWKGGLIFTQVNSSTAWAFDQGAIAGNAQTAPLAIDVGSRFSHGGFLKGMWTWSYNGGAGFDDFLVAISSAGDIVVWEGDYVDTDNFMVKGVWYVGEVPRGRRCAANVSGDLHVIGALGVVPMSRLVQGGADESADKYITYKIQNLVRNFLRDSSRDFGWSITSHPSYGLEIINAPVQPISGKYFQLVLSQQIGSWSVFSDINATSWETWHSFEYAGLTDGRVVRLRGSSDTKQVLLGTYEIKAIQWSVLTAYQSGEQPANWKRVHFCRPVLLTEATPSYSVHIQYDFMAIDPYIIDDPALVAFPLWDTALWDIASWMGQSITEQPVIGTVGMGRWFAVAMNGKSVYATSLVGFDLVGDVGGLL